MTQKLFVFTGFLLALPLASEAMPHASYVGAGSTEANYTYSTTVEIEQARKPSGAQAKAAAVLQAKHLFGPWSFTESKAVPRLDARIEVQKVREVGAGRFAVHYTYSGTIVLQKRPGATQGDTGVFEAILPVNPALIYKSAKFKGQTPCTDSHYPTEEDFWYFWAPAPYRPKCKLIDGIDYLRVEGRFERLQQTRITYPEYDRLADPDTGVIEVSVFFGMDRASPHNIDPDHSADANAKPYVEFRSALRGMGYELKRLERDERQSLISDRTVSAGYFTLEQLSKFTPRGMVIANLYFGPTGINEASRAFHQLYRTALENHAVVMHNGHSELGEALDPKAIEKLRDFTIRVPKSRYQIYFFNSCSSYTYYTDSYFKLKQTRSDPRGFQNLDILANGLSTYFETERHTDLAVLKAIDNWASRGIWTSYQELARRIDSDNLFGVNGDEDNPTEPRRRKD